MFLQKPIAYLDNKDIKDNGTLNISTQKPVFIMLQANFCGYCTQAKPDFQKLANDLQNKVFFATIQGDGKEKDEPVSNSKLQALCNNNFVGFPTYILIKNNNNRLIYNGGRDYNSMKNFIELNL